MSGERKIIELLTDMLFEQKKTNERLDSLEKQKARTNMELSEMRLSFMKIAEKFPIYNGHEDRIQRLEEIVLH